MTIKCGERLSLSVHTHSVFRSVEGLNFPRLWADSAVFTLFSNSHTEGLIFRHVMNAEGAASSWDETGLLLGRGGGSVSSGLPVSPPTE